MERDRPSNQQIHPADQQRQCTGLTQAPADLTEKGGLDQILQRGVRFFCFALDLVILGLLLFNLDVQTCNFCRISANISA